MPQAEQLTNLQQLVLEPCLDDEGDDDAPWEQLCSLTALRVAGFTSRVPSCLDRLTLLRSLHLTRTRGGEHFSDAEALVLNGALPALQHLTHLGLDLVLPSPPASLASLRQLRSFCFLSYEEDSTDPGQLPAGPWLAGLGRLAGTCRLLLASLPDLAAATQLQELGMLLVVDAEQQSAVSILQWAAGLPAMRRVRLQCWRWERSMRRAAEAAAQQLAPLAVEFAVADLVGGEYDWGGHPARPAPPLPLRP